MGKIITKNKYKGKSNEYLEEILSEASVHLLTLQDILAKLPANTFLAREGTKADIRKTEIKINMITSELNRRKNS